jgi:hypothetical protein
MVALRQEGYSFVRDALVWKALFGSGVRMLCSDVYPEHLPCRFTPTRYLLIDESGISTLAGSSGGKVPPRGRQWVKRKGPDFSEAFGAEIPPSVRETCSYKSSLTHRLW